MWSSINHARGEGWEGVVHKYVYSGRVGLHQLYRPQ